MTAEYSKWTDIISCIGSVDLKSDMIGYSFQKIMSDSQIVRNAVTLHRSRAVQEQSYTGKNQ